MSTELDFPPIDSAPAGTTIAELPANEPDLKKVELKDVALAQFGPWRADVATTRATLTGLVLDLSTGKGLADAKSLRQRLINAPLAEARKISTAVKSKLTAVGRDVGAELELIEAAYMGTETAKGLVDLITPQIEAREAEIAEEKRIAAEKEAARVQAHRDGLAKLAAPAERAALPEMTAERIANGIAAVEAIVIDRAAWEEFADRAEEQKAVTLERMRALHAQALAREEEAARAAAEAARLKAEREEAERVAAAQKAEADRLAALAAELERERAAIQAEKDRAAAEAQAKADEAARLEREQREEAERQARELQVARARSEAAEAAKNSEAQAPEHVLKAEAETPDATDPGAPVITSPSVGSMGAGQAADAAPQAEAAEVPMLKLGELWDALGLTDREAFLASIGFASTPAPKGTGKLYRHSDMQAICLAIASRFTDLAKAQPATA